MDTNLIDLTSNSPKKRKQSSLDHFMISKSPKTAINQPIPNTTTSSSQQSQPLQLPDDQKSTENEKEKSSNHLTKNVFDVLINNSKLLNKKLKAIFILDYIDGKFLPNFIINPITIQELLSKQSSSISQYWQTEVNVTNFRWFTIPTGYREVNLILMSNLSPSSSAASSSSSSSSSFISTNNVSNPFQTGMGSKSVTPPEESKSLINISLIKSMIQKGVRRKMTQRVMNLTLQLAADNPMELLRRMVIICLEDVLLHPAVPIVVWLMVAMTKGYMFDEIFATICVSMMGDLCAAEYRDCYPPSHNIIEMIGQVQQLILPVSEGNSLESHVSLSPSGSAELRSIYDLIPNAGWRTIIASLFIRASYGGMDFDRIMLEKYGLLWLTRILTLHTTKLSNVQQSSDNFSSLYMHDQYLQNLQLTAENSSHLDVTHRVLNPWGVEMLRIFTLSPSIALPAQLVQSFQKRQLVLTQTHNLEAGRFANGRRYIEPTDLIAEGVDFHCDWNLINFVLDNGKAELIKYFKNHSQIINLHEYEDMSSTVTIELKEGNDDFIDKEFVIDYLKQVIWIFRSSVSNHKLWSFLNESSSAFIHFDILSTYHTYERNTLKKKEQLSSLWRIICPIIKTYCDRKLHQLSNLLKYNN